MFEAPEAIAFGVAYLVAVMILCVVGVIVPLTAKGEKPSPVQRCRGCHRLIEVAPDKYRCTVRGELTTAPDSCDDCL